MLNYCIPKIKLCFDHEDDSLSHIEIISKIFIQILPPELFLETFTEKQIKLLHSLLPFTTCLPYYKAPGKASFFFLAKYRNSSFKFFFEMISHWLIPGKELNVGMAYAADFQMPEVSSDIYTICEITLTVKESEELYQMLKLFPILEPELRLGLESSYYASRILEDKGLAADEKTASIHHHIGHLAKRLPKTFDHGILAEMQHVLVMCREEFKIIRSSRHLSRIISIQYLFRKALLEAIKHEPEQRQLSLKLFKEQLHLSKNKTNVLCILVGVSFLRDREFLEEKHLLKVIQSHVPEAQSVENSFFVDRRNMENISTLYLEVIKNDGTDFSFDEISLLRENLPKELKENIEQLIQPVFMPCNEEEIMRDILSLSNEIHYIRDIPQIIINFNEQTQTHLSFTVIMVRVLLPGSISIDDIFRPRNSLLEYTHDRSKAVGILRKKHPKEAIVFQVKLPKNSFLRRDQSIDLYKARQALVVDLSTVIGEFRDFNGGMITKQNEVLNALKELLGNETKYNELLLENFFFSLMPVTMRSLLEPQALKTLFLMLSNASEHGFSAGCNYRIQQDLDFIYILTKIDSATQEESL
ncbi:MAG: hypothetical protein ACXWM7_02485, partial [Parachlamydiaceae bacterium]